MRATTPDDTDLARRATGGDGQAFGLLFDRWLDRAFDVAWHVVHDRETAADVSQEAFATAWQQIGTLRQPESFGGWLLRITRNKALNRLQRERRSRPTGSEEALVTLDARQADDPSGPVEQREHVDLLWAASAALGEEDASLLSLHLRHDLGAPELAEELGVQPNAVHQRLFRLKRRLADAIGAWVLWRGGAPSCPELRAVLSRAEASRFDRSTAKAVVGHARGCDTCDSSRQLRLSPEALFTTMPLVPAGPVLRAKVVAALQGQDIPVPRSEPSEPQGPDQHTKPGEQGPDQPIEPHGRAGRERAGTSDDAARSDDTIASDAGEPHDTSAPEGAGGPQAAETAETIHTSASRRGRRAALVGGAAVVALLAGAALLAALLTGSGDDGTTGAASGPAAVASEASEPQRRSTTTPTADDPTTTDSTTTTTAAATTTPAGETPPPGPPATPTRTTDPVDATGSGTAPGPTGRDDGDNGAGTQAPTIAGFTARASSRSCGSAGEVEVVFVWETGHATSATLGPQGGQPEPVPPNGSATRCAHPGTTWALAASGPGGTAVAQATVPSSGAFAQP